MKKFILPGLLIIGLLLIASSLDEITDFTSSLVSSRPKVVYDSPNEYANKTDYHYVQISKDFVPYSRQDLLNIFYTIFDSGYETFTFYCPDEYVDCIADVESLTQDQTVITDIGNFVHPYNNFTNLQVVTDTLGEVDLTVKRSYTEEMKNAINAKVDEILNEVTTEDMSLDDKVLAIHDYIINHAAYDQEGKENSSNAYGTLIDGSSKCAGYADSMAIFLSKLGLKNFKVASEKHVWNAVYMDDTWNQIDLTWDDPIVQDGAALSETIRHKFYMIDTETLQSYDTNEHNFDKTIYLELK